MTTKVLLLTEDSARDAHATVATLLRKLLQHVAPHDARTVEVQPIPKSLSKAVRGNRWKSTREADHRDVVALRRAIAVRVAQERGFVVFHVDADVPWSKRATSENVEVFKKLVRDKVQILLDEMKKPASCIERLFVLHPHYSIEAWLYQNTREAVRIAREHRCDEDCAQKFEAWGQDRTLLDELDKPKEQCCLRDLHSLTLAGAGFPTDEVVCAGRSFHAAREALAANEELRRCLCSTTPAVETT